MKYTAVWGKDKIKEKNCTLAFVYDLSCSVGDLVCISINASNIYKLYLDNKLMGYGPARAAHGFSKITKLIPFRRSQFCFIYRELCGLRD